MGRWPYCWWDHMWSWYGRGGHTCVGVPRGTSGGRSGMIAGVFQWSAAVGASDYRCQLYHSLTLCLTHALSLSLSVTTTHSLTSHCLSLLSLSFSLSLSLFTLPPSLYGRGVTDQLLGAMPDGSTVKVLNLQILFPPENNSGEVSAILTK